MTKIITLPTSFCVLYCHGNRSITHFHRRATLFYIPSLPFFLNLIFSRSLASQELQSAATLPRKKMEGKIFKVSLCLSRLYAAILRDAKLASDTVKRVCTSSLKKKTGARERVYWSV